jgi:hypothetical protein
MLVSQVDLMQQLCTCTLLIVHAMYARDAAKLQRLLLLLLLLTRCNMSK